MFDSVLKKVFGTKHQREVKRMQPMVSAISALERSGDALAVARERKQHVVEGWSRRKRPDKKLR